MTVSVGQDLVLEVLGDRASTGMTLGQGQWRLLGVSWRGEDGLAVVSLDGVEVWRGVLAVGESVPFGGTLVVGPLRGAVDEVALFDAFKTPATWLNRRRVAHGLGAPSKLPSSLPVQAMVQSGHSDQVFSVGWSPDGARIASGSLDNTVKVWDASTGTLLRNLTGHASMVYFVAWSPDGARIASRSNDKTVRIWDALTGEVLHDLEGHDSLGLDGLGSVQWSPDGAHIASRNKGNTLKIWNTATGKLLHELKGRAGSVTSMGWSPDGARIAVGGNDGVVEVWDVASGASLRVLEGHSKRIWSVAWGPGGGRLVSSSGDGTAKVWDASSGALLHSLEGHSGNVFSVGWSPDGARIASTSSDGTVREWDAAGGALLRTVEGQSLWLWSVGWGPDGSARAWDTSRGMMPQNPKGHASGLWSVDWSPDGARVASGGGDNTVKVWDIRDNTLIHDLKGHSHEIKSAHWHPDGARLALGGGGGAVKVWDTATGTLVQDLKGHQHLVRSVRWSPDGTRLATAGFDRTVKVWDAATGELIRDIKGHKEQIWSLGWSPDGARIASASKDRTVKVWNAATGELLRSLKGYALDVNAVGWSPDGKHLAAGSSDGTVKVWDAEDGALIHDIKDDPSGVFTVAWSPDGARIASGGGDKLVKLWDASSGARVGGFEGHSSDVNAVGWSPDGKHLASASWDGTVKVWDTEGGALLRSLDGHHERVFAVDWNPEGTRLASGSSDGTAKVWDVERSAAVTFLGGAGSWVAMTDAGHFAGHVSAPLALVQGTRAFSISQLAPARNRPDKVLAALGAPRAQTDFYEALWLRRLERLGLARGQVSEDFSSAPTARILAVEEPGGDGQVQIRAVLKDRVGLKSYRVYVNGVPTGTAATSIEGLRQRLTLSVQLTRGANLIEVTALNVQGVESLRASRVIEHGGQGLPAPRLFFLGFGVSDYADDRLDLGFAHQDVLDLAAFFGQVKGDFASVRTKTFTDAQVVEAALDEARAFLAEATEHDTLVMFIAGHGARDDDAERTYYYLDHDARFEALSTTAIPFDQMEALLYDARARKKLFLMDTCQSGEDLDIAALTAELEGAGELRARSVRGFKKTESAVVLGGSPEEASDGQAAAALWFSALRDRERMIMQDLARHSGAIVLASSLGQESSLETRAWGNGAFTEELLNALESSAADTNGDGQIDTRELTVYVTGAVPKLTSGRQHPNLERDNPLQTFALPIRAR